MQDVSELMKHCFQLVQIQPIAVEIGDQNRNRLTVFRGARSLNRESRRMSILAIARENIEINATELFA